MSLLIDRARKIIADGYEIGPRLHPCACGAARHAHIGKKMTGACPATGCRRYRRDAADALAERALDAGRSSILGDIVAWHSKVYPRPVPVDGGWGVGPSDLAKCQHAIQLRERPPADIHYDETSKDAATLGSIFHDVTVRARQFLYPWRKFEFEVQIPGLDRVGRMDEYDPLLAVGVDYKTCGEWAWEHLGTFGPKDEHWGQLAAYCYALACSGQPVEVMRLIYVNRATGEDEHWDRPYDEAFAKSCVDKLTSIVLALDLGLELPREGRGTSDPICVNHCEFFSYCWNVKAAKAAGRSPESYTILGEHPELEAIEWAAGQARGWKDNEAEAAREYKAAVPLLGGIPDGTYGVYVVKERRRTMPEYKKYYELIRRAYEDYQIWPADQRGDFADWVGQIELPVRRDVWTEVKHERASVKEARREVATK